MTAKHPATGNASETIFGRLPSYSADRQQINALYLADESDCVDAVLSGARLDDAARARIVNRARQWVTAVRANGRPTHGIKAFLQQYDLSSQEGMVLMCLAEALVRIPDAHTADSLIRDKLGKGRWGEHLGESKSLLVNASTWGLMLTGKMLTLEPAARDVSQFVNRTISRLGEPVVRAALRHGMRIMGHQFVMGRTINEALKRAADKDHCQYRHSFDMLGEAALTEADAQVFFDAYAAAIDAVGRTITAGTDGIAAPGISVKLSALHPRYELSRRRQVLDELVPRVQRLAQRAARAGVGLTVDAEEADRLDLSLDVIERVFRAGLPSGWDGFGLAIQAYQKRAVAVVEWVISLARQVDRRIPVRLVKGAYWDTEIKIAQVEGLAGYPVFTRKASTDVSYLACARTLLAARNQVYPQFATHNAHTVASVIEMAGKRHDYEFQRLHGMGDALYGQLMTDPTARVQCRVYAPVGRHQALLPYLVRRLLENGANTSFVNHITNDAVPIDDIVADPVAIVESQAVRAHPHIPLPQAIYGEQRCNARGINLTDVAELKRLAYAVERAMEAHCQAAPVIGGQTTSGASTPVFDPADQRRQVGDMVTATAADVERAVMLASSAQPRWDAIPATERAAILIQAAELYENHCAQLIGLLIREAGKTLTDAVAEVREAVDFLRYYGHCCRDSFAMPQAMPGYTGETNDLVLHGRGVFVCISPWNFPLAIFTGQVSAALAAGNSVVAKPAEQTSLIGALAVKLLHSAGVPAAALHFIPGAGETVGAQVVADERVAGVAFTGSHTTAKKIHRMLAERAGAIATLIAETGGQNAMIVDSSALPEQVVQDVVASAFHSAGQRCSALRVLYVQDAIAPRVIEMLAGYMGTMRVGDPGLLATDVGPIIDRSALALLREHVEWLKRHGTVLAEVGLSPRCDEGTFIAPVAVEVDSMEAIAHENFGPILHVIRYAPEDLDAVIDAINNSGYGLTLGIQSRIDTRVQYIAQRAAVGNVYVNRNMVGAVVGVQPFGGQGLSGTGPKAGGPHYLLRYASERTLTHNTAALGGNATLLALSG